MGTQKPNRQYRKVKKRTRRYRGGNFRTPPPLQYPPQSSFKPLPPPPLLRETLKNNTNNTKKFQNFQNFQKFQTQKKCKCSNDFLENLKEIDEDEYIPKELFNELETLKLCICSQEDDSEKLSKNANEIMEFIFSIFHADYGIKDMVHDIYNEMQILGKNETNLDGIFDKYLLHKGGDTGDTLSQQCICGKDFLEKTKNLKIKKDGNEIPQKLLDKVQTLKLCGCFQNPESEVQLSKKIQTQLSEIMNSIFEIEYKIKEKVDKFYKELKIIDSYPEETKRLRIYQHLEHINPLLYSFDGMRNQRDIIDSELKIGKKWSQLEPPKEMPRKRDTNTRKDKSRFLNFFTRKKRDKRL